MANGRRLADLTRGAADLTIRGDRATAVTGIACDSRLIEAGDLFVALRGGYFDGHQYVAEAARRGAAAVMVERDIAVDLPAIIAPETRAALPGVAARFFGRPSEGLNVVGITGTDGKTTTSLLVDAMLRFAGLRTGVVGTVAVRIGDDVVEHESRQTTPESVEVQRYLRRMVDAGVTWAILEATSHGLDLHRLDEIRFAIGAVTNVTHEHLDHHGTIEAYRRAKGKLFERVAAAGGTVVVNLDDPGARGMLSFAGRAKILTYSAEGNRADVVAREISLGVGGTRFRLRTTDAEAAITMPLIGGFNVANALCAAGVALTAGLSLAEIARALGAAPSVPGRMARVDEGQPFAVVVDYAHTPDSLTKVLELLRRLNPRGRLIAVSGSAGERDTRKRPLQGAVSARLADASVFTTEDPRFEDADKIIADIVAGALEAGGVEGQNVFRVTDRREAIRRALRMAGPGDCILLAGKGHERSIIWGHEKRSWDEARVVRELLRDMGYQARR